MLLAEEEWIEDQLATNPDFDPNEESTGVNTGVDEHPPSATNGSATGVAPTGTSETPISSATATGENGEQIEGDENSSEIKPRPKRYVRSNRFYFRFS